METLEQIIAEKNKEIADLKLQLELATEFCDSPCGHSSMWAHSAKKFVGLSQKVLTISWLSFMVSVQGGKIVSIKHLRG